MNGRNCPRPAGMSDESGSESSEDDFGFSYSGRSKRKSKPVGPTFTGESLSKMNGASTNDDWGGQPAATEEDWGSSPAEAVRLACSRGKLEKLKELLNGEYSTNVNQFFFASEQNPLIVAASNGQADVVEYLVKEKNANPNLKHPTGKVTALMEAVSCGLGFRETDDGKVLSIVKILVIAGATVDIQDSYGLSALMLASKRRRTSVVKYLLDNGADPNLFDHDDRTALFHAATQGEGAVCRMLLEHNADIYQIDRSGYTAADVAQENGHPGVANLLFIVRDTMWKPGLNPNLMEELDSQRWERRKNTDRFKVKEDSSIELVLAAVDGESFLKNFRKQKISFQQFLRLDNEDLKDIGVDELGVRERILDHIKKVHNAQWQNGSLRVMPANKDISAAEALCMVANTNEHISYIESSFDYLRNRISKKPLALRYGSEKNKIDDLIKFCERTQAGCLRVMKSAAQLNTLLDEVRDYTELQISGKIPKKSIEDFKKIKSGRKAKGNGSAHAIIISLCTTVGAAIIVYKFWKS